MCHPCETGQQQKRSGMKESISAADCLTCYGKGEIVDDFGPRSFNTMILPHWTVGAIVQVPGGAYPSYAQGYYKRDNAFYLAWDKIARDRDTFLAWMKVNVLEKGPEAFAVHSKRLRVAAE